MVKTAFITGIGGMDGSHLADILLEKGYIVHGLVRRSSTDNLTRLRHVLTNPNLFIHSGDITDYASLAELLYHTNPDEVYHEADQDHIEFSTCTPSYSVDVTIGGSVNLLEAVRLNCRDARVFIPVSATMFGGVDKGIGSYPQDETTPFNPQSPYACSKVAVYHFARHYREKHEMFVSTGIMYNHHSPRRIGKYLLNYLIESCLKAKKVGDAIVQVQLNNPKTWLDLGDPIEYMHAAWSMLQLSTPDDFCIATGGGANLLNTAYYVAHLLRISINVEQVRQENPTFLTSNCLKARNAFGFAPQNHLTQIVQNIVASYGVSQ